MKRNTSKAAVGGDDGLGGEVKFLHLVVPENVEMKGLGFKLKWKFGKCVVYDVQLGSIAERHGLTNGTKLLVAGGTPIHEESLMTKQLLHGKRPLELVFGEQATLLSTRRRKKFGQPRTS